MRIEVPHTRFATGYAVPFVAQNTGRILASRWDFGDGTVVTNQAFVSHAWSSPGLYTVRLTGYNDTFPAGVTSAVEVEVVHAVHYVNAANPSPVFPYTSWETAATNIQDAVAAGTVVGRLVLVTNGLYRTGSVELDGGNRVVLTNPVVLRSVNGPSVTLIEGATEGIRCIYVGDGALVSGFTLTNGVSRGYGWGCKGGGGAYCEPFAVVTNCVVTGNSSLWSDNYSGDSLYHGGGVQGGTLYNCSLRNNSGDYGGGTYESTLRNCTLADNSANYAGGGAISSTLHNCSLTGNSARSGGGAYGSTLYNCTLTSNSAGWGGGAYSSTLYNCIVMDNTAGQGGGVYSHFGGRFVGWLPTNTLYNCTLIGNTAQAGGGAYGGANLELHNCIVMDNTARQGGGTAGGTLYNCVVTGNSADEAGGVTGAWGFSSGDGNAPYHPAQLRNCILYFNQAPRDANYASASFEYSCTTPLPEGPGNIDALPQLTWDLHLLPTSPCVAAGSADHATGRDMDGEPWTNPPSMGADQFLPGPVTGALTVQIYSDSPQVAPGYALTFVAQNTGRLMGLEWDFGDGVVVSNRAFVSHTWETAGTYTVRLTGYNDSFPAGVTSTVQVEVINAVHYVNVANPNPAFPYTSWATAATNIQEAVVASTVPGRLVLVTNGVYGTGVVMANGTNRVALTNSLVLRSVNGPAATMIDGGGSVRCAYLGPNTVISGFTLTNGAAEIGGGVWCADLGQVTNCVLTGNSAFGGWGYGGGGVSGGTLYNCTLTNNWADLGGGGAAESTLYNCTLTGNSTRGGGGFSGGGGAVSSTLYDCTLQQFSF